MTVSPKAASAGGEEVNRRDGEAVGGVESEAHVAVGDDAGDAGAVGRMVESVDEVQERRQAVLSEGFAKLRDVLSCVLVGRREAVGDGCETEVRQAGDGGRPP